MKKLFTCIIMLSVSLAVYAVDIELDPGFPIGLYKKQNLVKKENIEFYPANGTVRDSYCNSVFEVKADFFLYSPTQHIDLGLETGLGLLTWGKTKLSSGLPGADDNGTESNFYLLLGAVMRYNLERNKSFSVSVGIKPLYGEIDLPNQERINYQGEPSLYTDYVYISEIDYYLSAAYKYWLIANENFHLGINTGLTVFITSGGYSFLHDSGGLRYSIDSGFGTNAFLGVCINFGKLSLDRY